MYPSPTILLEFAIYIKSFTLSYNFNSPKLSMAIPIKAPKIVTISIPSMDLAFSGLVGFISSNCSSCSINYYSASGEAGTILDTAKYCCKVPNSSGRSSEPLPTASSKICLIADNSSSGLVIRLGSSGSISGSGMMSKSMIVDPFLTLTILILLGSIPRKEAID